MRMTDPAKLAAALQMVPFRSGGGDWSGCDCWGINYLWYRNRFGLELDDRLGIAPGAIGLMQGAEAAAENGWIDVALEEGPRDDDTIIMRTVIVWLDKQERQQRQVIEQGHCGIFTDGMILHSSQSAGCRFEPFEARSIKGKVTKILRREELA